MRVLGIDPGYAIVGYGIIELEKNNPRAQMFGAITTLSHTKFEDRIAEVYEDLCAILKETKPDVMAIESLFFNNNQKTAVAVAQARGVILLAARLSQVPIFEYSPLQVKMAVAGYGRATKHQVQQMTRRLLNLKEVPKPDDAADALAIALCHANSARSLQFGKTETKRRQMGYY